MYSDTVVKIIAEVGVNHNGDIDLAKEMIDAAAESGASIVKFQSHIPDKEMLKDLHEHVDLLPNLYELISNVTLSYDGMFLLKDHCDRRGVEFLSTPFSLDAVDELEKMGVNSYKIGSGETDNLLLLDRVCQTGKHIFISSGLSTWKEVQRSVNFIKDRGASFTLMQCTSSYPADPSSLNISVLTKYKNTFNCPIGISDHSEGILSALIAIALGVEVIEKHFTTDKNLPGTDQKSSINPDELKALSEQSRLVIDMIGNEEEENSDNAYPGVRDVFRHCLVANGKLNCGDKISIDNISTRRPAVGILASEYEGILGKNLNCDIEDGRPIFKENINE